MFFKNQQIGKYRILDTIGTGGFGAVYLAEDSLIGKRVAVKVPHKQGENVEKLLQEPRLLAALNHPNIVSVITAERTNDVFYIVMEYVEGESLERYLRRNKPLDVATTLTWLTQIADAMAYAHGKNIIHRDIRPANVLLSREGQVKLADLGTSRYLLDHPHASTRIGSPPYMAPEHFQGKATFQSDIYSFGIMAYECLTGNLPFYDKNPKRLAQLARETQVPQVHEVNPSVPPAFAKLIARAMHRHLGSRYLSAVDLLADLKRIQVRDSDSSQELAHLVEGEQGVPDQRFQIPKYLPTREISNLFCWNCSRPIQKRTKSCPHCGESLR